MKNTVKKITNILKELQEGVDFTVESKKKVIFHNEKIVDCLEWEQEGAKWFYDAVRKLFTSIVCSYEEKENGNYVFTFKSGNNKKDSNQEIPINWEAEKKLKDQKNKGVSEEEFNKIDEQKKKWRGIKRNIRPRSLKWPLI